MNILFINHEKGGGGASFSLYELIKEFIKKGHHLFILTPYDEGEFYYKLKSLPITVLYEPYYLWEFGHYDLSTSIRLKCEWFLKKNIVNVKIAHKIAKYAIVNKIDIIHSNTSVINIGALISKYSGIPHVWHLREFGDLDIGVDFYGFRPFVYRFMNKYTNNFLCVSKAVFDYYDKLEKNKKIVVYNGVAATNIIEDKKSEKVVNILIAGHIFECKGQHEAVNACVMLLDQGIENFILNIAGSGNLYFDVPEKLQNNIKIWGEVRHLEELRKSMDIELVCSKCEAFGRVVVEAMLGGLVVIGSNAGGIPELITHGQNGFLYNNGDIATLCNLLKYLIENPDLREHIGKCSREYAKGKFLINRCADEIEYVYKEIIKK